MSAEGARPEQTHVGATDYTTSGSFGPLLTLLAAPLMLFPERFPVWAPPLGVAWIAGLWFARRSRTGSWSAATLLDVPVLALLCTLPSAILVAADFGAALSRAYSLIFAIALAFAIVNYTTTPRRAWFGAVWVMLAGLGLAALGLVSVDWLVKYPALEFVLDRVPRLLDAIPHATLGSVPGTPRVGVHPNNLAGLLVLVMPVALTCALPSAWVGGSLSNRRRHAEGRTDHHNGPPRIVRAVAVATLIGAAPVFVLTQSRGAWLGFAVVIAALFGLWMLRSLSMPSALRRHSWLIGGILSGVAVLGVVLVLVVAALQSDQPDLLREKGGGIWSAPSAAGRLRLWQDGLAMIAEKPLTGIGLHNFTLVHGYLPEYDSLVYQGYAHVHNQLLQAALDFGLPGFVAVVGLFVSIAWGVYRIRRHTAGSTLEPLVVGLALGLLAHALHGLVDAVAIGAKPGFIPWAMVGLIAAIRHRVHRWVPPDIDDDRRDLGPAAAHHKIRANGSSEQPAEAAEDVDQKGSTMSIRADVRHKTSAPTDVVPAVGPSEQFATAPSVDAESGKPHGVIDAYLNRLGSTLESLSRADIARAADMLVQACLERRRVYVCGNGGSAATASHMVNDLSKQAAVDGLPAFRAFALNDNVPLITAWSNDAEYAEAFARQLACHVEADDVVIGISTSGNSDNVLRALQVARSAGARTIGLTGHDGGAMSGMVDCCIFVDSDDIGHQEDVHLVLNHVITKAIRARLSAR